MIKVKRAYEPPVRADGWRVLVDRVWPRGVKKETLAADAWLKDVAPSTALRKWFGHTPERWPEFRRRYHAELDANPQAWQPLLEATERGVVTLLFSAHDLERNNAVALREYLRERAGARPRTPRTNDARRLPAPRAAARAPRAVRARSRAAGGARRTVARKAAVRKNPPERR